MMKTCAAVPLLFAALSGSQAFTSPLQYKAPTLSSLEQRQQTVCWYDQGRTQYDLYRDSYGERSRAFRRSFFQHDDWLKHRAFDRFPKTMKTIVGSGVVRQLAGEVGLVTLVATFVVIYNAIYFDGFTGFDGIEYQPLWPDTVLIKMVLPAAPFQLSSPALGLLLAYRTNVAYQRWDEARKAWGMIVNHSRNILRQGVSWVTEETEPNPEIRREKLMFFCNCVWAFARSMQRHLWGSHEDDIAFQLEVRKRMPRFEAEGLIAARHKPTRANADLTRAVNQLPMTYLRRVEIDKSAIAFADAMGACDRIFTSPVPLSYTRHTARFLALWILALPLVFYEPLSNTWNHIGLIPVSTIISFFFFGIEELSVELEEPFSILPLDKITEGIGLSADEHFAWHFEKGGTGSDKKKALYAFENKLMME